MEEELAKHLKQLADQFHGLTPVKCRELAFEYAEKNNIPVPANWTEKQCAAISAQGMHTIWHSDYICFDGRKESSSNATTERIQASSVFMLRVSRCAHIAQRSQKKPGGTLGLDRRKRALPADGNEYEDGTRLTTCGQRPEALELRA
ncbi:unnamed protein product [Pleuronectes platessa]|uniref:Uncharacterized protein n=1 Tax=Pleuronectes platessa TaxID=8262 RepID=A0A9N7YZN4_PLEPL|nr:unnamed protein product [Pleuronectes platessa]